jgi:colanic acid biosynthesis glycosyl transferase WcaI
MDIKKRILVLGINCFPEITGIGKYTGEMISWFAENGHETTMITGFPYYPNWIVQKPYSGNKFKKEILYDGKLTVYRCPLYVPADPSGFKRLIHEALFYFSASLVILLMLFKKKQDIIFAIAPPFHLGILALSYRLIRGGKIVYHVQDLQIEAAKDLGVLKHNWMFSILFSVEKFILKNVDIISTISQGMIAKIHDKVNKPIMFFPNWVDTAVFYPLPDRSSLKLKWGYHPDDHVVLYSGSIGFKQGLEALIEVAAKVKENSRIKILICGTGPHKDFLIKYAEELGLTNVKFMPLQDFNVFNEFLNMADVHLVLQRADASDLVMPSKLTSILAVGGLAIVTANEGTTLFDVIKDHAMGIIVKAENEKLLAEAIMNSADANHDKTRINARIYAERFLEKRNVLPQMLASLFETRTDNVYHLRTKPVTSVSDRNTY